jgi:hypothetical protein
MSPHRSLQRTLLAPVQLTLFALLALGIACSGGGGGSGGSSGGTTGSVGVLLTDGPVDPSQFSHIYVTVTEITLIASDGGQVTIFNGSEVFDLRDLTDASTLVTVGQDVPAGTYEKIRLEVSKIELVPADGSSSIFPKLPPKIDLNPRGTFEVRPGELLLVQLDMDAGKSIHVVGKGNGGFNFRPVIFCDILTKALPGKLVLLNGKVQTLATSGFQLCDTHAVSRPLGATRTTETAGSGSTTDRCVDVSANSQTSFFDESGDPATLGAVMVKDTAWVLGRFVRNGEQLDFAAEVVELGDHVLAVDGTVASEIGTDDRFDLELDPGQGIVAPNNTLPILLQQGTKLFRRSTGQEIMKADLQVDDPARAVGVLALSNTSDDELKAAFVVIDDAAMSLERIEGTITSVANGGANLQVQTSTGSQCVDVPSTARVFEVSQDNSSADDIDRSALMVNDVVNIFGTPGTSCFQADTVIVFE